MLISWLEAHSLVGVALTLLLLFLVLNLAAYRYVYAYTHFRPDGSSTVGTRSFWGRLQWLCWPPLQARPELNDHAQRHGLSCEVHTFAGGRGQLEGWLLPHADPSHLVLIFHGYRASKARLLPEAAALHDLGCTCFLIDFPGSGGSEGEGVSIGYHEAEDVGRTVAYARSRWPGLPVVLYGVSMGSVAVLRALAVHHVRADAAILECPFNRLLSTVAARFRNAGAPAFPSAHLFVFWGGVQFGYNGFAHNPMEYARRVTLPVCLLHGGEDRRVSRSEIQSVYDSLAGEKELHFFESLGHESYVSREPRKWKQIVADFLQRHPEAEQAADTAQAHPLRFTEIHPSRGE